MQTAINFITDSPVNVDKLSRQNRLIYDWLISGRTINRYMADNMWGVSNLHSRISDLRNKHKVEISDKFIKVMDRFGGLVSVKGYWIENVKQEDKQ